MSETAEKPVEVLPITPVPVPEPAPEEEEDEEGVDAEDIDLIAEAAEKLHDRIVQRQSEIGSESFMRKMQSSFAVTTRAELRDWIYALLIELSKFVGTLAEDTSEIVGRLDEVAEVTEKQGYILQAFASNSILGVSARLAELVLARVPDDKELRELAQIICTSMGAANAKE